MHVKIHLIESHPTYWVVYGYFNIRHFFIIEIMKDDFDVKEFKLKSNLLKQSHFEYIYNCAMLSIEHQLVYIREVNELNEESISESGEKENVA